MHGLMMGVIRMSRNYERAIRRWLPLTYEPKIPGVLDGSITQTIRIGTDLMVGDWIAFHGWQGKPYRSPWSFRTPYMDVVLAKDIVITDSFIALNPGSPGSTGILDEISIDHLAENDGIQPATGTELLRLIHEMHGHGILNGKVIRWDPTPLKVKTP